MGSSVVVGFTTGIVRPPSDVHRGPPNAMRPGPKPGRSPVNPKPSRRTSVGPIWGPRRRGYSAVAVGPVNRGWFSGAGPHPFVWGMVRRSCSSSGCGHASPRIALTLTNQLPLGPWSRSPLHGAVYRSGRGPSPAWLILGTLRAPRPAAGWRSRATRATPAVRRLPSSLRVHPHSGGASVLAVIRQWRAPGRYPRRRSTPPIGARLMCSWAGPFASSPGSSLGHRTDAQSARRGWSRGPPSVAGAGIALCP